MLGSERAHGHEECRNEVPNPIAAHTQQRKRAPNSYSRNKAKSHVSVRRGLEGDPAGRVDAVELGLGREQDVLRSQSGSLVAGNVREPRKTVALILLDKQRGRYVYRAKVDGFLLGQRQKDAMAGQRVVRKYCIMRY